MYDCSTWVLFVGFWLLSIGVIHAQTVTACPPGMIPNGSGSCGYGQSQDQSAPITPAPRWSAMWGAIATYVPKGVLGSSTNLPTRQLAEQSALQDCRAKGGTDCTVELSYGNQCAAVVLGHPDFGAFAAPTLDEVIDKAMKSCIDDGNTNCRVIYTACSLSRRIK